MMEKAKENPLGSTPRPEAGSLRPGAFVSRQQMEPRSAVGAKGITPEAGKFSFGGWARAGEKLTSLRRNSDESKRPALEWGSQKASRTLSESSKVPAPGPGIEEMLKDEVPVMEKRINFKRSA